jgi:hypothetical protein
MHKFIAGIIANFYLGVMFSHFLGKPASSSYLQVVVWCGISITKRSAWSASVLPIRQKVLDDQKLAETLASSIITASHLQARI